LDNLNGSKDDCAADDESDIDRYNAIDDPECPEQQDASAKPIVPGSVQSTHKSKKQAEKVLVTVKQ